MANTTGIILAGGQGSRLGGRDKGWIEWQGKPLIAHVVERLRPQVNGIVISCNRNLEQYRQFGYPVCSDNLQDFQGPLAGIEAGLALCRTELAFICPCDSPQLPGALVERLHNALLNHRAAVAYVHDGERDQYLFALLHARLHPDLLQYLQDGRRTVRHWYQRHRAIAVDCSDWQPQFRNINTPDELATLRTP